MAVAVMKIGDHRWVRATNYGPPEGIGRSGVWVPQRSGGYWMSPGSNRLSVERAILGCPDPVTYRTRREAASEDILPA